MRRSPDWCAARCASASGDRERPAQRAGRAARLAPARRRADAPGRRHRRHRVRGPAHADADRHPRGAVPQRDTAPRAAARRPGDDQLALSIPGRGCRLRGAATDPGSRRRRGGNGDSAPARRGRLAESRGQDGEAGLPGRLRSGQRPGRPAGDRARPGSDAAPRLGPVRSLVAQRVRAGRRAVHQRRTVHRRARQPSHHGRAVCSTWARRSPPTATW